MLMLRRDLREEQDGFASIVIAIVLILVLSLITVGFAELMRTEQHSALDRQLSDQAYYAAEAGVNDAAKALNAGYATQKTSCAPLASSDSDPGAQYLMNNQVGGSSAISYPCLLINPTPTDLEYSSIGQVSSRVVEISGEDSSGNPAPIDYINIGWNDPNGGSSFVPAADGNQFDTQGNWTYTGVLEIGLTPLASGSISRSGFTSDTYNAYLYPNAYPAAETTQAEYPEYSYASGSGTNGTLTGSIDNGNCNSDSLPRYCNVQITGLGQQSYILDMHSLYANTRVTISAYGYDGSVLRVANAQTLVDSTGKDQNVLKRIQVRIPSRNNYPVPDNSLTAMSGVCKQLQLEPSDVGPSDSLCTP